MLFRMLVIIAIILFPLTLSAVEFDQPGETSSCAISMSMRLWPMDPDDQFGRVVVEVTLKEKNGTPIPGKQIQMTASWGTFYCKFPLEKDSTGKEIVSDQDCYTTDQNGKIKIHLTNLIVGETVKVKATCDCGGYFVNATGNVTLKNEMRKK